MTSFNLGVTMVARLSISVVILTLVACLLARADDYVRFFGAYYERPFGEIGIGRDSDFGAAFYVIDNKDAHGTGTVAAGHIPGLTHDCWTKQVHFCLQSNAGITLAIPHPNENVGWSIRLESHTSTLLAKKQVWFHDKRIDAITLRVTNDLLQGQGPVIVVYNYDIGVIAYATVSSGEIDPRSEEAGEAMLRYVNILAGSDGIGGTTNCKYWRCGSARR